MTINESTDSLIKGCRKKISIHKPPYFTNCGGYMFCEICKTRIQERLKVLDEWKDWIISFRGNVLRYYRFQNTEYNQELEKMEKEISSQQEKLRGALK